VAERLPAEERPTVVGEALSAARGIYPPKVRARTLAELAERLPPEDALEVALTIDERSELALIMSERNERFGSLQKVVERLATTQDATSLARQWVKILRVLATRARSDCVLDFCAVALLIDVLGGAAAIRRLGVSVALVGRWWR
jgi:hypothetical protein